MKKTALIGSIIIAIIFCVSCVTKQKYNELDALYKKCSTDLTYVTSEKMDFENQNKDLSQEVTRLSTMVEKLKNDTLTMTRRLRQSERDLAKSKRDYDDLLKDFAELNMANNSEVSKLISDLDKIKLQLKEREEELNRQYTELNLLQIELVDKEARLNELQKILDQKDSEVKALKDKVLKALTGFEGSGLKVYEKNGKVYVSMDEKLLFASASWEINKDGEAAIKELAKILEQDPEINVLVEGHTDNVPYKGAGQVKDNWDLSVMRSTSVVKTLLKSANIDPQRVAASGRGEYFPIENSDTATARAKNRRTEIILTPRLDELFQIIGNN
ncbi:MAG: OmpA family protein [Bacteroidales bacterium]|jgi:chemotaxis protein MotB|nr:OmpA family protein [Bacteroidales bacterium]